MPPTNTPSRWLRSPRRRRRCWLPMRLCVAQPVIAARRLRRLGARGQGKLALAATAGSSAEQTVLLHDAASSYLAATGETAPGASTRGLPGSRWRQMGMDLPSLGLRESDTDAAPEQSHTCSAAISGERCSPRGAQLAVAEAEGMLRQLQRPVDCGNARALVVSMEDMPHGLGCAL